MIFPETIPKDWKLGTIMSFSRIKNDKAVQIGPFGSQLHHSDYVENGTPVILPKSIINQKIVKELNPQTSDEFVRKLSRYKIKKGDLILSRIVPIDKVAIINEEQEGWLISGDILRVRLDNPEINNKFLYYLFQSDWFVKIHTSRLVGTTTKKSNEKIISNLPLAIPSLEEQEGIIKILQETDSILDYNSNLISYLDLLKKGLMQRLFSDGIGHTEFTEDNQLGRRPKEWKIKKLKDVTKKFVNGGTPPTSNHEYWNGEIPWITSNAIKGNVTYKDEKFIHPSGLKFTNIVPKGDILLVSRTGIGKFSIAGNDIAISQDFTGILLNHDLVNNSFILWLLLHYQNRLIRLKQGSTIQGLLRKDIEDFLIPLPEIEEQNIIAEILDNIEHQINLNNELIEKFKIIKKALMQQLLTGQKRVSLN